MNGMDDMDGMDEGRRQLMRYFSGITWVLHNHHRDYTGYTDKVYPHYVVNYLHDGKLGLQMDGGPWRDLDAPVAWLCFPGPRFHFRSRDGLPFEYMYISFKGPRVQRYMDEGLFPWRLSPPVVPVRQAERLFETYQRLFERMRMPNQGGGRSVLLLEDLLLQLHEQQHSPEPFSNLDQGVLQLARDIRREPEAHWDFRSEAKRLHVSYAHLRRCFRRLNQLPPNQFVLHARLDHAAELLRREADSIQRIARASGFDDLFYFSRLFKRHYGLPPSRYRLEAQG